MPEPRMAYITNRRLFENAFEIAAKHQVSAVLAKISLKLSSKINASTYMVKLWKTKLAKEIAKRYEKKCINTEKVWNMGELSSTYQWTNIQTNHHYRRF